MTQGLAPGLTSGLTPGLTLLQGIFISLLIHGALAAPVLLLRFAGDAPDAPPAELLNLDFLGVKSKQQVAAKTSGDEKNQNAHPANAASPPPPPTAPIAQARPRKDPSPKAAPPGPARKEREQVSDPSSQTHIEALAPPTSAAPETPPEQKEQAEQAEREPRDAAPLADAPRVSANPQAIRTQGADADRQQQSLEDEKKKNEEATRQYLAKLHRAISPYVKFPPEARHLTASVMPKVRFRVDERGHIVDDRVEILLSSGHPTLDQAAIRATRHGAPFPIPPRAMTIAMRIEFIVK